MPSCEYKIYSGTKYLFSTYDMFEARRYEKDGYVVKTISLL